MKEYGYLVSLPYATFGLFSRAGIIINAAPIANWCIGNTTFYVLLYYKNKGAVIHKLP